MKIQKREGKSGSRERLSQYMYLDYNACGAIIEHFATHSYGLLFIKSLMEPT